MEYPQGSLLGSRLFSLYVNDLPSAKTSSEACLFADDSTFHFIGTNKEEVTDALNETGRSDCYLVFQKQADHSRRKI